MDATMARVVRVATLVLGVALVVPLVSATAGSTGSALDARTIRVALGSEPPSLDPQLGADTVSAQVTLSIMDPLVVLRGKNQRPVPNLASGWTVSGGGKIYTIHLRHTGRWTNGDPVTASDFEYSWKRELDPALAAPYAYIMYGIKGALAFNTCKRSCARLRDRVGVKALDRYTIRVTLERPQPWFPYLLAHNVFFAVPRATVERWGNKWTEPSHIVTNGAFRLVRWRHDAEVDLTKWSGWRNASRVPIENVKLPIITNGTTAVLAFEAGRVDALTTQMLGPADIPRFKSKPDYYESPQLATYYVGFNLKKITDVNQRRAMAMAIDRRALVDHVTFSGEPAEGFTPKGIPGFASIDPHSRFLPARANLAAAKALMAKVAHPVKKITLYYPNAPGGKEMTVVLQAMWQQLGISTTLHAQEFKQFLQFLGPPPNSDVDSFLLSWVYDFPDAMNAFELFTCGSGNNNTNRCNRHSDALVARARPVQDADLRYRLYGGIEQAMFGPNGDMPVVPLYWGANVALVGPRIRDTFRIDPQTYIHFDEIKVKQ
jgi:oligopeptide transport system substrate-binding protein